MAPFVSGFLVIVVLHHFVIASPAEQPTQEPSVTTTLTPNWNGDAAKLTTLYSTITTNSNEWIVNDTNTTLIDWYIDYVYILF